MNQAATNHENHHEGNNGHLLLHHQNHHHHQNHQNQVGQTGQTTTPSASLLGHNGMAQAQVMGHGLGGDESEEDGEEGVSPEFVPAVAGDVEM